MRVSLRLYATMLAGFLGLAACAPQPLPVVPTDTFTPAPTLSPTTTPVWFPPTNTPTPAPTITPRPTQEFRPGLGEVILEDDFSDPSGWRSGTFDSGRITFGSADLTLAVSAPQGSLVSLRQGQIAADSYLEITADPALCKGDDAFGLLLRASGDREGYRLLATCMGKLRMERLRPSETALMQDWTASGELPKGGMLPVKLGVWAVGTEMRIFVNDVYQFSVRDPLYPAGQVGVFARSAGSNPLTVSFSDLSVRAIDLDRLPTATPRPTDTP